MKVSDLFAEIGFKVDTKGLSDFESNMSKIQKTIKGCLSDFKEFAKAADQIARAFASISTMNALSDKGIVVDIGLLQAR